MKALSHCATKVNDSLVILTGGIDNLGGTLIVDIASPNYPMIPGPQMLHKRYYHASGTFIVNNVTVLIVAGGYDGHEFLSSTEIWVPSMDVGSWQPGIFNILHGVS